MFDFMYINCIGWYSETHWVFTAEAPTDNWFRDSDLRVDLNFGLGDSGARAGCIQARGTNVWSAFGRRAVATHTQVHYCLPQAFHPSPSLGWKLVDWRYVYGLSNDFSCIALCIFYMTCTSVSMGSGNTSSTQYVPALTQRLILLRRSMIFS